MKEQRIGPGVPPESTPNTRTTEFAFRHNERELTNLFAESGLFYTYTPPGRDKTVYPMEVLDRLHFDLRMKARPIAPHNTRLAAQLESWKTSIDKVSMAYEIIVYPYLDRAERSFAKAPLKDPNAPSPAAVRSSINEGIRDAQEHPNKDLAEYPHRGPIELTPLENYLLGRVARTRGLPFDPKTRIYHYLEALPHLQARSKALQAKTLRRASNAPPPTRTSTRLPEDPSFDASSNDRPWLKRS
jgi:hypothetical protein